MKKWFIIGLLVLVLIVVAGGVYFFMKKPALTQPSATNPFGSVPSQNVLPTGDILTVTFSDGTQASVPNFTKTNQPSWAGPSGYEVAGTPDADFLITYIPKDSAGHREQFLITLQKEPLGATRKAAEDALRQKLQLTNAQLCALDTQVRAAPGLNDAYNGQILGLSFCSGSVMLP